jgi:hypothetical protein
MRETLNLGLRTVKHLAHEVSLAVRTVHAMRDVVLGIAGRMKMTGFAAQDVN